LREVAREVDFYNLDAIIAVGYRVNSREATQFRIWATQVLREYLIRSNTTQCRARGSRRRQRRRLKQEPPAAPPAPRPHRPFEALIEKRPQGYDPMKTMPVRKAPPAPFTTATLLQAASVTLGYKPNQTALLAQRLFEQGVSP
jgi:DNA topoisomerase IA